jgi:hypothetical protein
MPTARRQFGKKWQHLRSKRLANHDLVRRITAVDLKNALGQVSRPIVVIFMADGSLFARERPGAFTLAPSYREREPSTSTAFGRRQRRLTGNLVSSPAPDRVSVGTRFKQWPRLAMTHGFGVPTARTERASVRRT